MNDTAPPIRIISTPLRLWLPLGMLLATLVIIGVFVAMEARQELATVQQRALQTIRTAASQMAPTIRRALEAGDSGYLRTLISSLVLEDEIDFAALTDEKLHIIQASRYAWNGQYLPSLIALSPQFHLNLANDAIGTITTDDGLLGIVSIHYTTAQGGTPQEKIALLHLKIDTERARLASLQNIGVRFSVGAGIGLLLTLGVLWLLRRHATGPLEQLSQVASRIADDDFSFELEVEGKGEIAGLAQAMQHMAQRIRETVSALRESEQRLSVTLDSIGDAVLVTDVQGLVTRLNAKAEELTGWSEQEALGRPVIEIFHIVNAETREPAEHPIGRVLREGVVVGLANHTTLIARNGREYQIADSAAPILDAEGRTLGVIMVFQDVSDRYRMESELMALHARLNAILTSLPDPCFLLDGEGRYLDVMGGSDELLAINREQLLGRRVADVLPPEDAIPILRTVEETLALRKPQRLEYRLDTLSGTRHFEGATAPIELENGEQAVIWLARDKTEQKAAEDQLQHMVFHDQLTGLANRELMAQRIEDAIARARRQGSFGAVLFLDIDQFKDINDSLGHPAGDQLLIKIARLLRKGIRGEDLASRFGGDEFVVVLEGLGSDMISASSRAEYIAQKLSQLCNAPILLDGHEQHVTLSIGISIFPDDASTPDVLLKQADMAMFKAKQSGRDRICFFASELQQAAENRLKLQRELRQAVEQQQFELFIQPGVDAEGRWVSGEVLARWRHPEKGLVLPGSFIPAAEAAGLIGRIDRWVLSQAVNRLAGMQNRLPEYFEGLSLNVTADLLLTATFPEQLRMWMSDATLDPSLIELEITERVLLDDHQRAAQVIETLRNLGVHFSIDDFGTGCSSLRYLQRLPIDTLKIDRSFVERLPHHAGDSRIVTTIIDMARHLALDVIAEGVENEEQLAFLRDSGCHRFQGYHFARPMPWDEFFERLGA